VACFARGLAALVKSARLAGFAAVLLASGPLAAQDAPKLAQDVTEKRPLQPAIGAIASMKHDIQTFGKTNDGQEVKVHTLTNSKGLRVRLIDYGATLISVEAPDKSGKNANITLGFPTLDGYLQRHPFFGSTAGRFANRIAKGQFTLEGKTYTLATNN
jgi:hypothetical protein